MGSKQWEAISMNIYGENQEKLKSTGCKASINSRKEDRNLLWDNPAAAAFNLSGLTGVYLSRRESFAVEAWNEFSVLGNCHLQIIHYQLIWSNSSNYIAKDRMRLWNHLL